MTDPENHLDLARDALDLTRPPARQAYRKSETPREFAAIEQALIGIGHALLAIHEQLERHAVSKPNITLENIEGLARSLRYPGATGGVVTCNGCGNPAGEGHRIGCSVAAAETDVHDRRLAEADTGK